MKIAQEAPSLRDGKVRKEMFFCDALQKFIFM